uniref:Macro domain-containing protein n=1 Tax=Spongospora subterranea TaxID=70186 RepID=A0A0H5QWA8_9EUKA|eukprot:CRZ06200.1 hypothetical protein [Spongospora subterranea]
MGTIVEALSLPTWREYYRDHHVGIQERRRRREVNFFLNWFSARISRCPPSEADLSEKVSLWPGGDLTLLACDAIVNAANTGLWAGGGICGAIFNAAGSSQLKQACKAIDHCNTGESCITSGFNLPATFIIHAVGPVSNNNLALARTYISALNLAKRHRIRTIGFCCISTGIYGFPRHCVCYLQYLAFNTDKYFIRRQ